MKLNLGCADDIDGAEGGQRRYRPSRKSHKNLARCRGEATKFEGHVRIQKRKRRMTVRENFSRDSMGSRPDAATGRMVVNLPDPNRSRDSRRDCCKPAG